MKSSRPFVALALLALGLFTFTNRSRAAEAAADSTAEKIPPQRFETKVLRVIAAMDGEAIFRAYIVKWKDQEVIASDPLAKSNYREGDTIEVLAMNHPYPQGRESHRLLAFTVVPGRR